MSRRNQINMSESEIKQFIQSSRTMILVTNGKNGFPHPMPMWFGLDEQEDIVMTTFRKSQKVLNIKRDPKVTLLVETGDQYTELKSVLMYANARIIDDLTATTEALLAVSRFRGEVSGASEAAARQGMEKTASKRVVIRFDNVDIVSWDHSKLGGTY